MRLQSILYAMLNVPIQALLRSPLHGIVGDSLCLLSYRGRRSERAITTPLSYVRDGDVVRLLTSHNTNWWKNFVGDAADVELEIKRERLTGRATALTEDGQRFRDGIRSFLTSLPRDALVYGIKLDADKKPRESDIEAAAGHVVLVEVQLAG
ncbi:MAG: hypothetical protein CL908_04655 [Deltaproteobacteria bacterium]|jgi:hypothetical protein|nr:hypothetical protein [Deltaproteobacteria bacterium]